jgi:putative hydrolase of the HAD superfamily
VALRAVILDYGLVLSGPQEPHARAELMRITGLESERFEQLYWADRPAFDVGELSGFEYWQKIATESGLSLGPEAIDELNHWDGRMWTTENRPMIDWQAALKGHGLKTAILSNMGDTILASLERDFEWLDRFDVLIWSYQHGVGKPDEEIYRLTLEKLGVRAGETLFVDDRPRNVEAARRLGIKTFQYTTTERLRAELLEQGLDRELPLPE